jgi:hypothetical protein
MHKCVSSLLAFAFVTVLPAAAMAQDERMVGVTMGFPESVGVVWHATEKLALRPEFSFTLASSENDFADTSSRSFSTGLAALFYLDRSERFATYLSPRYAFQRGSATVESPFGEEDKSKQRVHLFSGSFGAQYWLGERFSVFGELGLAFQRSSAEDADDDRDEGSANSFGTRSSVGLVFYFQ